MNSPLCTTSIPTESQFAAQLKSAREASGITQTEFASALGVSPQAVWKWESGTAFPRRHRQAAIDSILGDSSPAPTSGMIVFADLLDELVAAEQIIQTLSAQMTDAQRLAASESLAVIGFPVEGTARCQPRRSAIAAARKAGAA